jgi:hypothetical protein
VIQYQKNQRVQDLEENTAIRILCLALSAVLDIYDIHIGSKSSIREEKEPSELGPFEKPNVDQWSQCNDIRYTSDYGNLQLSQAFRE